MSDPAPLAEAGASPLVAWVSAFVGVAVTVAGGVAQALRFSGRIASAEDAAKTAVGQAAAATAAAGKLADENKALRAEVTTLSATVDRIRVERPSSPIGEQELQRRIAEAVKDANERLEDEVRRLRDAAERGQENHHKVELALARVTTLLERDMGSVR